MKKSIALPFATWRLEIIAAIVLLACMGLTSHLNVGMAEKLHEFLFKRGLAQYLILFLLIRNVLAAGFLFTSRSLPKCHAQQLLAYSAITLAMAIPGFIRMTSYALYDLGGYIYSHGSTGTGAEAVSVFLHYMVFATDNLLLGLMGAVIGFSLYIQALARSRAPASSDPLPP